jgi:hypothetical protein
VLDAWERKFELARRALRMLLLWDPTAVVFIWLTGLVVPQ